MNDEQVSALFRTVADHLESLAISLQNVEDLQEQDRTRQEADHARQQADHARLDRLERLFKLMIRIGDRERKDLRDRINALIDAQMRSEAVFVAFQTQVAESQQKVDERMAQLADSQKKTDEGMTRFEESTAHFQAQVAESQQKVDERLVQLAASQQKADERVSRFEASTAQFQVQVAQMLRQLADATALAHRRLDVVEANEQG